MSEPLVPFKSIEAKLLDIRADVVPRVVENLRVCVVIDDGIVKGAVPLEAAEANRLVSSLRRALRDLAAFEEGYGPEVAPTPDPINLTCSSCGKPRSIVIDGVSYCGRCAEAAGVRPTGKIV